MSHVGTMYGKALFYAKYLRELVFVLLMVKIHRNYNLRKEAYLEHREFDSDFWLSRHLCLHGHEWYREPSV